MKFRLDKNYFLNFLILSFVFISTTALSLSITGSGKEPQFPVVTFGKKIFPQNPVLKDGVSTFPMISAQGVIVSDLGSGQVLYEKNSDSPLLPASTTKIVTALTAMDAFQPDQILTIPQGINVEGQKIGLFRGEQFRFEDLLEALLVYSANDAAMALALNYPGGYDSFVSAMNEKAKNLSMVNSNFENPVGLDSAGQTTTAKDLLRVSEVAMRNPVFERIVGLKTVDITDITGKNKYHLSNVNKLLDSVPGVAGIKTGWTENARENLVTYIERDGHKLIIVVLGSQDRFGETKELIDWIFASYEWQDVEAPEVTFVGPKS
jgi:D-alanyl-D-alanine carboxypeptidase